MRNIRIALITFAQNKPGQLKLGLLLAGILAGILDSWYLTRDAMMLSTTGMGLLFAISTISYLVLLTLYRIVQRIFRIGRNLPKEIREYDERSLVRHAGLFGVIPFGVTLFVLSLFSSTDLMGFGMILIVQGCSIYLGAGLSQLIKK